MPTLYAMQQRTLPPRTELGLRLDPTTHEIAGVLPGSAADACGISEGDILVGINDTMVVNFEYAPGPAEGTILVGRTSASADSNAVLASAQAAGADLVLNILKPMDAGAPPPNAAAATLMRAPPTASRQQQPQGNGVWSGPFPSIKGQRRLPPQREPPPPSEPSPVRREAVPKAQQPDALAHYPWATAFEDGLGQVKNRYNLKTGSMLQPMVRLDGADKQLDSIRRKEIFAAEMRPGTATAAYALNR